MRISRRLRGFIAAAITTGALLALPGAAFAAPIYELTLSPTTPTLESGGLATYQLTIDNSGDAVGGTGGTIQIIEEWNFNTVNVEGTPVVAGAQAANVTMAADSETITVQPTFGTGAATVTFNVRLPERYTQWRLAADGTSNNLANEYDSEPAVRAVSKGGPSALEIQVAPDAAKSVAKDGTYTANVTVRNTASGSAEYVRINRFLDGQASEFSPTWGGAPAFTPAFAFTAGCSAVDGSTCVIGTIAAGETKTITIQLTGLTHYGTANFQLFGSKADNAGSNGYTSRSVQITNGKSSLVNMALEAPQTGAGNTDITFNGEFVNAGPDAIDSGLLYVDGDNFSPGGTLAESIKSITLSNGATCANRTDHTATPEVPIKTEFYCPVSNIAVGQRITFVVVANFATTDKNVSGSVNAQLLTTNYVAAGSDAFASDDVSLNVEKTVDLDISLESQVLIGADRVAKVTVRVKNNGNTKADTSSINGEVRGVGGSFDLATLPNECIGVAKPQFASCALGSIEPGATRTFEINVRAGSTLGVLAVRISTSWDTDLSNVFEGNPDNNAQIVTLQVVKANAVPLKGVIVARPKAQTLAQLTKSGVPTTVTCPVACKAVGQLQVNRVQAQKLGLVKAPRGTKRAKALPYIVIGTGTKSTNAAGKVTVVIKLTKAYKLKVAKLTKPLTVSRVITVTSLAPATKDASFQKAQAMSFKPAKMKR